MAKISFSKLGLKKLNNIKTVLINDQDIEVLQYLPTEQKLELITDVMNSCIDNNNFTNTVKFRMFMKLYIIKYYTNLTFTDKQWEDPFKLYDLIEENGIYTLLESIFNTEDVNCVWDDARTIMDGYYSYRNSIYGIMENLSLDTDHLAEQTKEIQQNLSDPENLKLVKDVLTKMG